MLVYAMCGTFVLVDLCRNKKDLKALNAQQPSAVEAAPETPVVPVAPQIVEDSAVQAIVAPVEEKAEVLNIQTFKIEVSKLHQNFRELKNIKDEGLITEDEYKKLKAKLIEKAEF